MDCVLLRHGIAVERDEWEGAEADRPLTERGAKRVAQVAAGLNRLGVQPTDVLSSPLIRAIETAKIVHRSLRVRSAVQIVEELLPDAPPDRLLSILRDLPLESCLLCIGHEPQLGMAASFMLFGRATASCPMKKAGACLIELPMPVKPGRGALRWWLTPRQLREMGKHGSAEC
ncbi:MAG: 2,3-bisphosphoglycerate-dependent phosphoglycerate mutase [Nitrospira sp.]|jgi:phosphohistidine phosphatase|nr:2,3-bisphosphoglycerate-dependent phosphoglycerate mutase [Nitrospira sp.]